MALLQAAERGTYNECLRAINSGANVNQTDVDERTALMWAVREGHFDICQLLIKKGAKINTQNKRGWTALMSAAQGGHLKISKLLIENKADLNIQNQDGWTPLMWAAFENDVEICEILIKAGANADIQDADGWTALISSSQNGNFDICKLLVESKVADLDKQNKLGWTALMWAAYENDARISNLLIDFGADQDLRDKKGQTAFTLAPSDQILQLGLRDVNSQTELKDSTHRATIDKRLFMRKKSMDISKRTYLTKKKNLLTQQKQDRINSLNEDKTRNNSLTGMYPNKKMSSPSHEFQKYDMTMNTKGSTAIQFAAMAKTSSLPTVPASKNMAPAAAVSPPANDTPASPSTVQSNTRNRPPSANTDIQHKDIALRFQAKLFKQREDVQKSLFRAIEKDKEKQTIGADYISMLRTIERFPLFSHLLNSCDTLLDDFNTYQKLKSISNKEYHTYRQSVINTIKSVFSFDSTVSDRQQYNEKISSLHEFNENVSKIIRMTENNGGVTNTEMDSKSMSFKDLGMSLISFELPDNSAQLEELKYVLKRTQAETNGLYVLSLGHMIDSDTINDSEMSKKINEELSKALDREKETSIALSNLCNSNDDIQATLKEMRENQCLWKPLKAKLDQLVKLIEYVNRFVEFDDCTEESDSYMRSSFQNTCRCFTCQKRAIVDMIEKSNQSMKANKLYEADKAYLEMRRMQLDPGASDDEDPIIAVLKRQIDTYELGSSASSGSDWKNVINLRKQLLFEIQAFYPEWLEDFSLMRQFELEDSVQVECSLRGIYFGQRTANEMYTVEQRLSFNNGREILLVQSDNLGSSSQKYCVKRLHLELHTLSSQKELRRRFYEQCCTLDKIRHPNLIRVFAVFDEVSGGGQAQKKRPCMITPFYERGDLDRWMKNNPPATRSFDLTQRFLMDILDALQHLHKNELVHCDIKPSNVFVSDTSRAVLADFDGITGDDEQYKTTVSGTFEYLAPEIKNEAKAIFHKSTDMYAVGVLAKNLFAGVKMTSLKALEFEQLVSALVELNTNIRFTSSQALRHKFFG